MIWAVCSWDASWHPSWLYFGRVLGGFWVPRWAQNPKKIDLGPFKKLYKKIVVLDALKIDFGRILASKMEGLGGAKLLLWRSFFGLGRVLGPRWPL